MLKAVDALSTAEVFRVDHERARLARRADQSKLQLAPNELRKPSPLEGRRLSEAEAVSSLKFHRKSSDVSPEIFWDGTTPIPPRKIGSELRAKSVGRAFLLADLDSTEAASRNACPTKIGTGRRPSLHASDRCGPRVSPDNR